MQIENQKRIFKDYTDEYILNSDDEKINGYIDKQNHSFFVQEEALLIDEIFTRYNNSFLELLSLESLFHDIGRFEQLKVTNTFIDFDLKNFYKNLSDHGDLGAYIIEKDGLLKKLIPNTRIYDEQIKKVIKMHSKLNTNSFDFDIDKYVKLYKNYDLKELFLSNNTKKEKEILSLINIMIIQDVDRLDIFRKIVKKIWIPKSSEDILDDKLFELFKNGNLPTINEIKNMGKWNSNIAHLVRLSFIDQINLIPVLKKIKNENLIDKIYNVCGNEFVKDAYNYTKDNLDNIINNSDGILVKKLKK